MDKPDDHARIVLNVEYDYPKAWIFKDDNIYNMKYVLTKRNQRERDKESQT